MENTMRYLRNPLNEYKNFQYKNWDDIFPDFRGETPKEEILKLVNILEGSNARNVLDFGIGEGKELLSVATNNKKILNFTGIDIDKEMIIKAKKSFEKNNINIDLLCMDWKDIETCPELKEKFDFTLLTGNCLTHDWFTNYDVTLSYFRDLIKKFKVTIKNNGYLLIDSRNFDFILSLENKSIEERISIFKSMKNVCYHGLNSRKFAFPAYIANNLVVFHYYDLDTMVWSANDFFPLTHSAMLKIISGVFDIDKVYWDYEEVYKGKSHFIQYLLRV